MDQKSKMKIFGGFASMLVLLVLVVASSFVLFRPDSFAWLAHRDQVTANGMETDVKMIDVHITYYQKTIADGEYEELDSFGKIFEGLYPGDTVWIKVSYENVDDIDHTVKISLTGFDGCEVPLVIDNVDDNEDDDEYYYLGTQLKVLAEGVDAFLLAPSDNLVSHEAEQTVSNIALGSLALPAGETTEFEFSIRFVNYASVDQSAYRNFGSQGDECCYREITSDFE